MRYRLEKGADLSQLVELVDRLNQVAWAWRMTARPDYHGTIEAIEAVSDWINLNLKRVGGK